MTHPLSRTLCLLLLIALAAPAGLLALSREDVAASVLSAMDPSADPCSDFYRYACGNWLKDNPLPDDENRWVRSFSVLAERNREVVREILGAAAADPAATGERRQLGQFYGACLDEAAIEKAGTRPLAPWLDAIARVDGPKSLMATAGALQLQGVNVLLSVGVEADPKHPETMITFFAQGGLGMPDRDYYVSTDPTKVELLAAYRRHVARMLRLLGETEADAARQGDAIVAFETELAKNSRTAAQLRLPEELYHKLDFAGLAALTPKLDWQAFRQGLDAPGLEAINVATPEFFTGLEKLVLATSPETLRAYLRWHLVRTAAPLLPAAYVEADFDFFGRTLSGQRQIQPRGERCVDATTAAFGEAVGKLFVEREFAGTSKEIAATMLRDIAQAFEASLPSLRWMDDPTRERARVKARAILNQVGYPNRWRDYSALRVVPGEYLANTFAASAHEARRQLAQVGKPVDPEEWSMTPHTVNASYHPIRNRILFPAGILQPPFFHRDFPAPLNYGAVGTVMGHELTHGFDDEGRKFDAEGYLREWWEPQVSRAFETQAACVDRQYSSYEIEPGVAVDGRLTLGENIADVGGLKQAYAAWKSWEARNPGQSWSVGSLTPDQLFFVGHAQVWCSQISPEAARMRVTIDPHAPSQFRVRGPIVNHPAFGQAFGCPLGSPMNPVEKCEVW